MTDTGVFPYEPQTDWPAWRNEAGRVPTSSILCPLCGTPSQSVEYGRGCLNHRCPCDEFRESVDTALRFDTAALREYLLANPTVAADLAALAQR